MSLRLLGSLIFLGSLLMAELKSRRKPRALRLIAANEWVLCQLCGATARMCLFPPAPRHVDIDLSAISSLKDSSVLLLEIACDRWRRAGAAVCVAGCRPEVRRAIQQRGSSQLWSALLPPPGDAAEMTHMQGRRESAMT